MLISLTDTLKPVKALSKPQMGIVVDNVDPDQLGRVKVTIEGLLEADKEKLPWVAVVCDPSKLDVPEIGDKLYIVFPYGSIYFPFSLGYWHSADNTNNDLKTDYPNTMGISKQGFIVRYNKKEQIGDIVHPSGASLTLSKTGSLSILLKENLAWTIEGSVSYTATGDILFSTDGNAGFTAKGNFNAAVDGNVSITAKGNAVFSGTAGTTVGDASSATIINGATVALAGGGLPVATVGSKSLGTGNLGAPVMSIVIQGSTKVSAI